MSSNHQILNSYGTATNHILAQRITSLSDIPHNQSTKHNEELIEARTRMRAYQRYKDSQIRCYSHFNIYIRLIPRTHIHTRNNTHNAVDNNIVTQLLHIIDNHGWSDNLGYVIVSDDSIIPPGGPGTNIRSYLLPPTFSIVHGHSYIHALEVASKKGVVVPDKIVVQVAVPIEGTSLGDTEVRLLQLIMTLNRFKPQNTTTSQSSVTAPTQVTTPKPVTIQKQVSTQKEITPNKISQDLQRLILLRNWLNASPEFGKLTVHSIGKGHVPRVALQAVKEQVLGKQGSRLYTQDKHMQRYVRAILVFKDAPKVFHLFQCLNEGNKKLLSVLTMSSGALLKAEPDLKVLILECICAYLNKRQTRFEKTQDTVFIRNVIKIYNTLKPAASNLGYKGSSFLSTVTVLSNAENSNTRTSTIRDAIIAAASSESMTMDEYDALGFSSRLQEALAVASKGKTHLPPTVDVTAALPLSTTKKPSDERQAPKVKNAHQRDIGEGTEETSSLSLAYPDTQKRHANIDAWEESSNMRSEESEALEHEQTQMVRGAHMMVTKIKRGQKRSRSPQPVSILRQKVLKRNRPIQLSKVKSRNPNGDMLYNSNKKVYELPNSEQVMLAAFPACIPKDHRARCHLSAADLQCIRGELRAYSSENSCAHHGAFKDIQDRELETSVLQCVQFATFWSDHKAALDEKGYTQIKLPLPWLMSSAKKLLKDSGCLHAEVDSELRDRKGRARTENSPKLYRFENTKLGFHRTRASGDLNGECPCPKICKDGMVVETVLAVIAEWLGLYNIENGLPSHAMSEKGCSLLLPAKRRKELRPRLAFGLRSRNGSRSPWNPPTDPSYMFVVTTESGLPIWVWERTHVTLSGPSELLPVIAKSAKPQRVFVEPRSVFLCRGDVVHAFGAVSELDGSHPSIPVAVLGHLVQRSVDRQEHQTSDGWWMKHISRPVSRNDSDA